jgi:hypothetical protein
MAFAIRSSFLHYLQSDVICYQNVHEIVSPKSMKGKQHIRETEVKSLHEVIQEMYSRFANNKKFKEAAIRDAWAHLMGLSVAKRTGFIRIEKTTVIFEITSSPLRHNLVSQKSEILSKLKEDNGLKWVEEIGFC